jgi:hypothetical protein
MSFFDDAIGTLGRGLAQTAAGALTDATGVDVGGIMNTLFGSGQTSGGETLGAIQQELSTDWKGSQATLTILSDGISQQGAQLLEMGTQISAIATAIASINTQLSSFAAMLANLAQQSLYLQWQNVDNEITEYIVQIDTAFASYGEYTSNYATTPCNEVKGLMTDVLNVNNGPSVALNAISAFILQDSQANSVLELWSQMVSPLIAAGQIDYRDAVRQYIAYYRKLAYAQLRATNLVMEAYNYNGDATSAASAWTAYKSTILRQESTFITWLLPLVYSAMQQSNPVSFTAVHAALQLDPGVQEIGTSGVGYIEPSAVLRSAEDLLASLYLTDPEDRRIVVLMAYCNDDPIGSMVTPVALTLTQADGGGGTIAAQTSSVLGPFPWPNRFVWLGELAPADDNLVYVESLNVRRFVFAADAGRTAGLPDGDYTITNLNGQDGLIPMETYVSAESNRPNAPFMTNNVATYVLHVDGARQFDFMNFLAYSLPISSPGTFT